MKYTLCSLVFCLILQSSFAQSDYVLDLENERESINQEFLDTNDSILKDILVKNGGLSFFPISEDYVVEAKFTLVDTPQVYISGTRMEGISFKMSSYAKLNFTLNGQEQELTVFTGTQLIRTETGDPVKSTPTHDDDDDDDVISLSLSFMDETSGVESYGAGRYLDIELTDVKNGMVTLDFNRCYNPACAYYEHTVCVRPPLINDLKTRVEAGVKSIRY